MTPTVLYTADQQRADIALVRRALCEPLPEPDRRRAAEVYERQLRRWARSEDQTVETETPRR